METGLRADVNQPVGLPQRARCADFIRAASPIAHRFLIRLRGVDTEASNQAPS